MEIRFRLLQRHWRTLGKTGHRSVCLKTEQTARLMCVLEIWSTCRTHRCFFLAVAWPLLCFSPFQYHWQVSSENQRGPGFKSTGSTKLANAGMVSMTHGHAYKTPKASTQEKETSNTAQLRGSTPPGKEVGTPCAEIVGWPSDMQMFARCCIDHHQLVETINAKTVLHVPQSMAQTLWQEELRSLSPPVNSVLHFLTEHKYKGLGYTYSALNSAWSAMSWISICSENTIGKHPLICRFLVGVFQ